MIAGLSSSGIAGAIRTAGQARATMDTMTRQIATGQRIASVKDESAAWARAATIKGERTRLNTGLDTLARVEVGVKQTAAVNDMAIERLDRLRDLVLAAQASTPGSQTRVNIQAEWSALVSMPAPFGDNYGFASWASWGGEFIMNPADPLFDGVRIFAFADLNQGWNDWMTAAPDAARPITIAAVDMSTATSAQLADLTTSITTYREAWHSWSTRRATMIGVGTGLDLKMIDSMRDRIQRDTDRLDTALGSLTDADLGKASAARATAETRQQLAISTVRQAISAYGNFAGGLLGNVQRTQRGIMA